MRSVSETFIQLNKISTLSFGVIGNTEFYYGNAESRTVEIISKVIPFGVALLLCREEDYLSKVKEIEERLIASNIKPIVIKNPSNEINNTIPENVRAIITFNNEYFNLAGKIATEKNLFSLFVITAFNFDNILNTYFEVDNNGKRQKIRLDYDRRILFDVDKIVEDDKGSVEEFAFIMSKLIALVDYRIFGIITESPTNKNAYNLVKSAVEETYSLFSKDRSEYLLSLIENGVKIRLADAITLGKFLQNSAVDICTKFHGDKNASLFYAKRLAKIYSIAFSAEFDGVSEPDYLSRAENLDRFETYKEVDYSRWLVYQGGLSKKREKEIALVKERLFTETSGYLKIFSKVEKTYLLLGGDKIEVNAEFIKMSGDFFETFNGMTLVRESGVSEFL